LHPESDNPFIGKGTILNKFLKSIRKRLAKLKCRIHGGKKMLILCDSHGGVFEYIHDNELLSPHYINCEVVGGATAYGLNNDQSSTRSFLKFSQAIKRYPTFDVIGIMLGEVDCSVTLWAVAQKRGVAAAELIPQAMRGYQRLIDYLQSNGKSRIVLFGSILPTVSDEQQPFQFEPLRRNVSTDQRQRTALVLAFNQQLQALAKDAGLDYLDITQETLDEKTGLVNQAFVIRDRIDHYQSQAMTAPFWCAKLLETSALNS
jgi:hypothetical protein